jgi:acyl-coenzyme A thioesterase PaaI-like protein
MSRPRPRVIGERQGKWLLNLYPPFVFGRIRVLDIGPGYRTCRVRIAKSLLTRNLNGTTFGGTIFSAADPFHALMYWQVFARRGRRVQVWLRRARIDYRKPAATPLVLEFTLGDPDVDEAEAALDRDGRFRRTFETAAVDRSGAVCATIETEVDLRVPRSEQKGVSAF